ncbi:hypothetical protein EJ06DRAFT_530270 [Trichodelitschia bisporula]|uniref:Uncharacterized protein n=1 Tax=Trichodelitschia bisporula TaxID=703511 RepID=A0A6G1HWI9_9PEZI|nr:hypothetical protein EJ06DRAFT_530270 [Trichodelitschia bisporula]
MSEPSIESSKPVCASTLLHHEQFSGNFQWCLSTLHVAALTHNGHHARYSAGMCSEVQ